MPEAWSREEVATIVDDHFSMLACELAGEPYSKREHNRRLQALLPKRSAGAIEYKHANISAILLELGFPCIEGYKPRANYQNLLRVGVSTRLESDSHLKSLAKAISEAPVEQPPRVLSPKEVFVDPPKQTNYRATYERRVEPPPSRRIDYLEREARNAALGAAGERYVLQLEHRRLWEAGQRRLAERIEHVSQSQGDGLGYDIMSFETNGRERLIEVKTTAFGSMTPFFATAREVSVSEAKSETFHLYRIFGFRASPKVFVLQGSLRKTCDIEPILFRASLS